MKYFLSLIVGILLIACSSASREESLIDMRVSHRTVNCVSEMEGECLLVQEGEAIGTADWKYFYFKDSIIGFDYEPGYIYDLVVKKTESPDPMADASAWRYELVRIKSKVKK